MKVFCLCFLELWCFLTFSPLHNSFTKPNIHRTGLPLSSPPSPYSPTGRYIFPSSRMSSVRICVFLRPRLVVMRRPRESRTNILTHRGLELTNIERGDLVFNLKLGNNYTVEWSCRRVPLEDLETGNIKYIPLSLRRTNLRSGVPLTSVDSFKVGLDDPGEGDWDALQLLQQGGQYLCLPAHQVLPDDSRQPKLL